ncbi:NUDIX hydrolase [Leucobacter weissii]|uniref:NUDIX hydrolase n=1 Tax=Leucobacter weissii TaxID=1983706 RepID=A0A939S9E9_9MICO|nr:NUDIX hydrolase [Leucobacter weissii]MBO1903071.1 NUDIX hydrolase [Leucobacter weissii]
MPNDGAPPAEGSEPLRDEPAGDVRVRSTELVAPGRVWDVRRERFAFGDGELTRDYVDHPGAVAALALDEAGRVLLIRQYRHAIAHRDWEIPAGLMDAPGESGADAARRELAEETDLEAERWDLLLDVWTSPGGSSEAVRVFLARDLRSARAPFEREGEEAELLLRWEPLDSAAEAVLAGRVRNAIAAAAVLAAVAARARGWSTLRPADAPWTARDLARGQRSSPSP